MTSPNVPTESRLQRYLHRFAAAAPQTAAVIGALASLSAPSSAEAMAERLERLAQRAPAVAQVASGTFQHLSDRPIGTSVCFGPIVSSGERAESLLYDRRLGVLAWLDGRGNPTDAPKHFKDAVLHVVGDVSPNGGPTGRVQYLFADHQSSDGIARTMSFARDRLNTMTENEVSGRKSPFAGCQLADLGNYRRQDEPGRVRAMGASIASEAANQLQWRVGSATREAVDKSVSAIITPTIHP